MHEETSEAHDTRRRRPRQARSKATVEAILVAAARVFTREGFDASTTNRVAEVAGVSVGSLYQYFPNKDALAAELLERHCDQVIDILERHLADAATRDRGPTRPTLRGLADDVVSAIVAMNRVDPALHRLLLTLGPRIGLADRLAAVSDRSERALKRFIASHDLGLRPVDPDIASFLLVAAVDAALHAAHQRRPDLIDDPRFPAELTELIVRFLAASPGDAAAR